MRLGPLVFHVERRSSEPDSTVNRTNDEAPFRQDRCTCGCEYFTAGGPVTVHESNGKRGRITQASAVLSCLGCGRRWYGTPSGLREPHEAALPPAWAHVDLQARMAREQQAQREAQLERQREAQQKQLVPPRGPAAGFRTPPRPA